MNNALSGVLGKFGSNFLISSMIPSLGLVISILTVFDPILQTSELFKDETGIYHVLGVGTLILVPTIIVGFTLTALNTYILKFFEGYVFFPRFPHLAANQRKKAKKLAHRRETLRSRIEKIKNWPSQTPRAKKILRQLEVKYYETAACYDKNFPPNPEKVLPTEFGNILKASEAYPATRYGMDAVEFWPRLIHVIPRRYKDAIDGSRNQLSFLVNMTILALAFFLLCLLTVLYVLAYVAITPIGTIAPIAVFAFSYRYILAGLLSLFCFFFFQKASLFSVGSFGLMIRSAFDLFRLDLLKKFHVKMPSNSVNEFKIWKNIGELIVLGQHHLKFAPLEYQFDNEKNPLDGKN